MLSKGGLTGTSNIYEFSLLRLSVSVMNASAPHPCKVIQLFPRRKIARKRFERRFLSYVQVQRVAKDEENTV